MSKRAERRCEWTGYKSPVDRRQHLTSCPLRGEDRDRVMMWPNDNPKGVTFHLWHLETITSFQKQTYLEVWLEWAGTFLSWLHVSEWVLSGHVSARDGASGFTLAGAVNGSALLWPSGCIHSETPFGIDYGAVTNLSDTCLKHTCFTNRHKSADAWLWARTRYTV